MIKTKNSMIFCYVWAGGLLMARFTPQNNQTIAWFYDVNGVMLGFTLNGVPYFYVRNLQGDVVSVIDIDGNVVAWYTYDSWGNILDYGGELAYTNPITYRGYYKDWATGLFYLQSRYYDPMLRRFISPDIYMDTADGIMGTNMYAYCHNDPINFYDPEGTKRLSGSMWDLDAHLAWLRENGGQEFDLSEAAKQFIGIHRNIHSILSEEYGHGTRFAISNITSDNNGVIHGTVGYIDPRGTERQFDFVAGRTPDMRAHANARNASWRGFRISHEVGMEMGLGMLPHSTPNGPNDIAFVQQAGWFVGGMGGILVYAVSPGQQILRAMNSMGASHSNHFVLLPTTPATRVYRPGGGAVR
ncbi:MAG: RHS repeat-associated core domain-containing protein [Oscillospiraceae bacterium]|nr:RHS repeat-associated core domain-containing protein [Oscillospiraceae bacterium]